MDNAEWVDGRVTAGAQSASVKRNMQLPEGSPAARGAGRHGARCAGAQPAVHLGRHPAAHLSAALQPLRRRPVLRHARGRGDPRGPGTSVRIRTDLSVTLFLAEPDEYDGGELTVEDKYGTQEVKLPAGDLVLYPSTSLHHVKPVTRGARVASFFWLQSMVRDDSARTLLFDLDQTIQELTAERGMEDPACVRLTGIYHNLIRYWADA